MNCAIYGHAKVNLIRKREIKRRFYDSLGNFPTIKIHHNPSKQNNVHIFDRAAPNSSKFGQVKTANRPPLDSRVGNLVI